MLSIFPFQQSLPSYRLSGGTNMELQSQSRQVVRCREKAHSSRPTQLSGPSSTSAGMHIRRSTATGGSCHLDPTPVIPALDPEGVRARLGLVFWLSQSQVFLNAFWILLPVGKAKYPVVHKNLILELHSLMRRACLVGIIRVLLSLVLSYADLSPSVLTQFLISAPLSASLPRGIDEVLL